jgi:hypothetical protein
MPRRAYGTVTTDEVMAEIAPSPLSSSTKRPPGPVLSRPASTVVSFARSGTPSYVSVPPPSKNVARPSSTPKPWLPARRFWPAGAG